MKKLLVGFLALTSISSFACQCAYDFDESMRFKSPGVYESVREVIKKDLGLTTVTEEEVSYTQAFMERFLGNPDHNSCLGRSADGKTKHQCVQRYTGVIKATIAEENCEVKIKVKRRRNRTKTKIISNTCNL